MKQKIIIDACVYVAAALKEVGSSSQFIHFCELNEQIEILWTQKLGYELHENFHANPYLAPIIRPESKADTFTWLEKVALLVDDVRLDNTLPLAHDRDDDYLVALAQREQAIIVTLDRLLMKHCPFGIEAMRPGEFREKLSKTE